MTANDKKMNELFERLVPTSGNAKTVAGEIVRATCRIGYRNWNDGDHLGIGYGRETVNPAGRFLAKKCGAEVEDAIMDAWGVYDDKTYDDKVDAITYAVLAYLEAHPELEQEKNDEDFWSFADPDEDVDRDDEEDW